ncbi:hypothetical protein GCM10023188_35890 [Pontibacter saemangeumensis]|uniref:Uncharacterized protein n=2 Tax=Pontibacter saemangeumensis TaxID=1084525 RepID=A0ABP8LXE6_9BACT
MLRLINGLGKHSNGIFYFDPDIVVKCRWDFYEKWIKYGVALVHEEVHNDKPPTHPIRMEWENIIIKNHFRTRRQIFSYINGGFCGTTLENKSFLILWAHFINVAINDYQVDPKRIWSFDKTYPFCFLDQDALNVAAMCADVSISEIGPEGMDFVQGGWTMSHAVGSSKPWRKNFILSALKGQPPTIADRMFWNYASSPLNNHSTAYISFKLFSISLAKFISRFYSRG